MRIQYNQLDDNVGERDKLFKRQNSFVEVNPGQVIMPKQYCEIGEEVLDSTVHASDIWLVSFPRAGRIRTKRNIICPVNIIILVTFVVTYYKVK